MTPLPRLVTGRLELVPLTHATAVAVVTGSPCGLRYAPGWPHADTVDALRAYAEHGRPGEDGGWLVVRRSDGTVVGDCGWRGGPGPDGEAEIGYGIAGPSRGQGLGTEAVAAMVGWCLRQPGVRALTARVEPTNSASRRLLERLGFTVRDPGPPRVDYVLTPGRPGPARRGAPAAG